MNGGNGQQQMIKQEDENHDYNGFIGSLIQDPSGQKLQHFIDGLFNRGLGEGNNLMPTAG
jgi:hypothetical protein